jgi:ribosome biogenesis GTPase A
LIWSLGDEFAGWLAAGQLLDAERQVKKDAIQTNRLIKLKKIPRPDRRTAANKPSS